MASQVQYRRGTNAQNAAFTGALAEITVDTTNGTLRVHDAITVGGSNIATVAYVTAQISALSSNSISSGTSNVRVFANSDVTTSAAGTANVLVVQSTGALITGVNSVSGNITGGNILTAGLVSATGAITGAAITGTSLTVSTGNITGGNLLLSGAIIDSAQLDIQTSAANANIALAPNGIGMVTVSTQVSVTGNITGGNLLISGAIEDSAQLDIRTTASNANIVFTPNGSGNVNTAANIMPTANATANIGSAALSFNTVFAKATSAQYADLAEKYSADAEYEPGTVVMFGGSQEITLCINDACSRVAGVVSTNPSYRMNDGLVSEHTAMVALTGRVPTSVTGTVCKGDMMVSAGNGTARAEANPEIGTVIGKALADHAGPSGIIEVVVGRV
jgi:hypothetical protein